MSKFFLFLFLAIHTQILWAQPHFYIGTFNERGSQGIYQMQFDKAQQSLQITDTTITRKSPSFLAVHPHLPVLYAVCREGLSENSGSLAAYAIDPVSGTLTLLNERDTQGKEPCHISVDPSGTFVYISHYVSGSLGVFPINTEGVIQPMAQLIEYESGSGIHPGRQDGPHTHSAVPSSDGNHLYVSDLGMDQIRVYGTGNSELPLQEIQLVRSEAGAGPRHLEIHPSGQFVFSAEELSSTLAVYRRNPDTGQLTFLQRTSTIPNAFTGKNSVADVHCSPDGHMVLVSNRGHESLAVFRFHQKKLLNGMAHVSTLGKRPRNFWIHPDEGQVWVANRNSDQIVLFSLEKRPPYLVPDGVSRPVPSPVCIVAWIP